jgi:hypothetical protein
MIQQHWERQRKRRKKKKKRDQERKADRKTRTPTHIFDVTSATVLHVDYYVTVCTRKHRSDASRDTTTMACRRPLAFV